MRIIAGYLKGRAFDSPGGHRTHPMSEKARGAIFNALGDIHGLRVLDAYGGSGALALEAISRGAQQVTVVELDKTAYNTIVKNVDNLNLDKQIQVLRRNVGSWAKSVQTEIYDIVLADPPYDDIRPDILERIGLLTKESGIFVLSWPGSEPARHFDGFELVSEKNYGDATLVFYRRQKV